MALFQTPQPDLEDAEVGRDIHRMRSELQSFLRVPRRWTGGLRRTAQARAIQGSNTIEGYTVSDQDALAAVDDEAPLTADERTWAEIVGYRRVLTYVLNVAAEPGFHIDLPVVNAMHFMLLEHDLTKDPGRYRRTSIYVRDDRADRTVYEGPDPELVPGLVRELSSVLAAPDERVDPLVRAAMAHLNLVMIHPYRDGNGRMARALQTMVLAQDALLEPTFASIEEWLGLNTDDYYAVLAATGRGRWNPGNDASAWVKFNLRAHHLQAQTLRRRFAEAESLYLALDEIVARYRLAERVTDPLFDAVLGGRVIRPTYVKRSEIEERTATRDLARLVDLGLLEAHGQTRARYYTAGDELEALRVRRRAGRAPLEDPYPQLMTYVRMARGAP